MSSRSYFDPDIFEHIYNSLMSQKRAFNSSHSSSSFVDSYNTIVKASELLLERLEDQADEGKKLISISGPYPSISLLYYSILNINPSLKKDTRISSYGMESLSPTIIIEYIGEE